MMATGVESTRVARGTGLVNEPRELSGNGNTRKPSPPDPDDQTDLNVRRLTRQSSSHGRCPDTQLTRLTAVSTLEAR